MSETEVRERKEKEDAVGLNRIPVEAIKSLGEEGIMLPTRFLIMVMREEINSNDCRETESTIKDTKKIMYLPHVYLSFILLLKFSLSV